jgi:hypothetical protein
VSELQIGRRKSSQNNIKTLCKRCITSVVNTNVYDVKALQISDVQDLQIHRSEIHSKLVSIMRERLAANLKQLPALAAKWGGGPPGPRAPSAFAQTNAKQLRILSQVKARL